MLSTCPSCLTQILHEDNTSQLMCECGEKFSPFLVPMAEVENGANTPIMAMSQKQPLAPFNSDLADLNEENLAIETPANQTRTPEPELDYSESESAFAELRSYGEHLGDALNLSEPSPSPAQSSSAATSQKTTPQAAPYSQSHASEPHKNLNCMITAGDMLSGYQIESFMAPLSVWSSTTVEAEDPLSQAHETIAHKATQMGANGVVSVRWSFTPDGTRILLTGTPVKCRKIE